MARTPQASAERLQAGFKPRKSVPQTPVCAHLTSKLFNRIPGADPGTEKNYHATARLKEGRSHEELLHRGHPSVVVPCCYILAICGPHLLVPWTSKIKEVTWDLACYALMFRMCFHFDHGHPRALGLRLQMAP